MPLHLLGKKSWNVYNADNIARVKRDEAAAQAREEAEEQRQQEVDAERRLAILRGEVPPPLPPSSAAAEDDATAGSSSRKRERNESSQGWGGEHRKRKRVGEDDTDFELRLARERATGAPQNTALVKGGNNGGTSNAPIVDHAGHIDLFPDERSQPQSRHHHKNEEAEKEKEKKKREFEDQYTMRFSNAAGKEGLTGPWYAKGGDTKEIIEQNLETPGKDVWGNEDPRRKDRETARVVSNDPLAMMKQGAAKAREVEKERKLLNAEREREMKILRKEEKRREKKRRREGRENDPNELEGFSLDGAASTPADSRHGGGGRDGPKSRVSDKHRSRDDRKHDEKHQRQKESDSRHRSSRKDDGSRNRRSSGPDRRRSARADHY